MKRFETFTGLVVPLDRANVDTDAIIPKQYLKAIGRTGFGPNLFDDWRYLDRGEPGMDHDKRRINSEFVLNQPRYARATILLGRENFGCGSSREHAVWALDDYGIRVVIAPSFADIFSSNAFKNGLLAITLDRATMDQLFRETIATPGYHLMVDLANQQIRLPSGQVIAFDADPFRKQCLIEGLDEIGSTLQHVDAIRAYESRRRTEAPWLFSA